jgi:DNA polymerase elongation subunit (family B)
MNAPKILVVDIETKPNLVYAWGLFDQRIGINQIVEPQDIICFAAQWVGASKVEVHAAWDDYPAMLQRLHDLYSEADFVVGYNQKNFDNKHIMAALAKAGMTPPAPWRDVDLLHVVRRHFKFPSNKLDYVCQALGLGKKVETGGMDLWTACMAGDAAAQRKMLNYNKQDVKITTELFHRLTPWISGVNFGVHSGDSDERPTCTNCGSTNVIRKGTAITTSVSYKRYLCECGKWLRARRSEAHKPMLVGV